MMGTNRFDLNGKLSTSSCVTSGAFSDALRMRLSTIWFVKKLMMMSSRRVTRSWCRVI